MQPRNGLYAIFDMHFCAKLCDSQNYRLTVKKSINIIKSTVLNTIIYYISGGQLGVRAAAFVVDEVKRYAHKCCVTMNVMSESFAIY
jgi:hypothetical protein